jgi:hypothetical protein
MGNAPQDRETTQKPAWQAPVVERIPIREVTKAANLPGNDGQGGQTGS